MEFEKKDEVAASERDGWGPDYSGYDPGGNGWTRGDGNPHVISGKIGPDGIGHFKVGFPPTANALNPGVENWFDEHDQVVTGWDVLVACLGRTVRMETQPSGSWSNGPVAGVQVHSHERASGKSFMVYGTAGEDYAVFNVRHLVVMKDNHRSWDRPPFEPGSPDEL